MKEGNRQINKQMKAVRGCILEDIIGLLLTVNFRI
jgi:hypothetical protein